MNLVLANWGLGLASDSVAVILGCSVSGAVDSVRIIIIY